jgi:hypothetical protein
MVAAPLRHLVERALATRLPTFDVWFPSTFDAAVFLADVPAMARRLDGGPPIPRADEAEVEELAGHTFRVAHVAALAVLAAGSEGDLDPDSVLERLTEAPEEEEEAEFGRLAEAELDAVEEALAEDRPPVLGDDAAEAVSLVEVVWPPVWALLSDDPEADLQGEGRRSRVLRSVARVAVILAALRWMAAARAHEDWPEAGGS